MSRDHPWPYNPLGQFPKNDPVNFAKRQNGTGDHGHGVCNPIGYGPRVSRVCWRATSTLSGFSWCNAIGYAAEARDWLAGERFEWESLVRDREVAKSRANAPCLFSHTQILRPTGGISETLNLAAPAAPPP